MAFAVPGRPTVIREGAVEGIIATTPRGAGGFGYDPIFEVEGGPQTMAELEEAQKNRISHRARALEAIREVLVAHFSLVEEGRRP
jgi:XTP/dITP diphosphohydrolase